ncbi:MAG: type II toxin-antitoxin system RelE/ParE family toxin [Phycisphaerae bacterium]
MKRSLYISEQAETDLTAIWHWTSNLFGETQADRYLDQLGASMRQCCDAPEGGKNREGLRQGYHSRRSGKHVIFYTFTALEVLIQRVLHGSMDFDSHLLDEQ